MDSDQLEDDSSYLFCHKISYIIRTSLVRFLLNILFDANFSTNSANPLPKAKPGQKKTILNQMSCQIKLNAMNMLLGVSGSGKSTLLKAFSNKTGTLPPGYQGQIFLPKSYPETEATSKPKPIYLVYVGQMDFFYEMFTVREQLEKVFDLKYANVDLRERVLAAATGTMGAMGDEERPDTSKLKEKLVQSLLEEMDLTGCADRKIKFCSGGEKKRLSIAVELVALPDILLIDEPTTGLDSSTSLQVIGFLERCVQTWNITVVAVIHQPSFLLFNKFDNVIVQDKNGQNLFNGLPSKLVGYLADFGLTCPENFNPADFVLDVANGDFDDLRIREELSAFQRERHSSILQRAALKIANKDRQTDLSVTDVNLGDAFYSLPKMVLRNCSFCWRHFGVLTYESFKIQLTDPLILYLRAAFYLMNLFAFHVAFGTLNGKYDGCPNHNLTGQFEPAHLAEVLKFNKENSEGTLSTSGNVYFTIYTACYSTAALPVILIPNELKIFIKQLSNQWYSFGSYYLSRVFADVPIIVAFVIAYGTLNILLTGVSTTFERFLYLMVTYVVLANFIHSAAFLLGGIFIDSANAAIYVISVGSIPLAMICERTKLATETPNLVIKALMQFSFVRYSFRAMSIALFGDRCDQMHKETFINYTVDMKDWLNDRLGVKTADDDPDFQGSGVTEEFTNNLVRLINGEYFNKNNKENPYELRSMVLNKLELANFRLTDQWLSLVLEMAVMRVLSVAIISFLVRKRIF